MSARVVENRDFPGKPDDISAEFVKLAEKVSRLVSVGGDPLWLASHVCLTFARSRLFHGAWIGLVDADNGDVIVRQAGFGGVLKRRFTEDQCWRCLWDVVNSKNHRPAQLRSHHREPCCSCVLGKQSATDHSVVAKLEHQSQLVGVLALSSFGATFNGEQKAMLRVLLAQLGLAFYDLRERARADAQRKESEDLYKAVFENTGMVLWVLEADGTISLANRESERLTGYTREETENRKRWEDFFVHEDVLRMRRYRNARLRSDHQHAAKQFQGRLVTRNGKMRTVLISPVVVPGTKRMIPAMVDITGWAQAERDVVRLNNYLQGIVDNANILVVLLDGRGRVRVWNRAAELITGYSAHEMMGRAKSLRAILPYPVNRRVSDTLVTRMRSGDTIEDLEVSILARNGESRLVSWYAKGIEDPKGKLLGIMILGRDLTEQREAEVQKREAERRAQHAERLAAIGEMAAGVAHEINNPLTAIIGLAELLERDSLSPATREYVEAIVEGGHRIGRIVDGLLTFTGRHASCNEPVSVNETIRRAAHSHQSALSSADIRLTLTLDSSEPLVLCDVDCLEMVFSNLISNALDELQELQTERELSVMTYRSGGTVVAEVRDNGRGIPASSVERIFEPFYTTKQPGKGTGLGLSICHGLVLECSGRIYARNNDRVGAALVVELPLLF